MCDISQSKYYLKNGTAIGDHAWIWFCLQLVTMIILQATPCIALIENYSFTESIIMISSQCIISMYCYRAFVYKNSFPTVIMRH